FYTPSVTLTRASSPYTGEPGLLLILLLVEGGGGEAYIALPQGKTFHRLLITSRNNFAKALQNVAVRPCHFIKKLEIFRKNLLTKWPP
ncbi:MAG: hypothetical protein IJM96_07585, partial [Clostridia bacterium]|nr:hypothetical protein [Clostridia bacterium]